MYSIGQQVRCIDARWGVATGTSLQRVNCPNLPTVGQIYTIRTIERLTAVYSEGPVWFVRLCEVQNPQLHGGEVVFRAVQFVPLDAHVTTDISFAHDILKNPNRTVKRDKSEIDFFKKGRRRERA